MHLVLQKYISMMALQTHRKPTIHEKFNQIWGNWLLNLTKNAFGSKQNVSASQAIENAVKVKISVILWSLSTHSTINWKWKPDFSRTRGQFRQSILLVYASRCKTIWGPRKPYSQSRIIWWSFQVMSYFCCVPNVSLSWELPTYLWQNYIGLCIAPKQYPLGHFSKQSFAYHKERRLNQNTAKFIAAWFSFSPHGPVEIRQF